MIVRNSSRARYFHNLLKQYKMKPLTHVGKDIVPGRRVRLRSEISLRATGAGTGFISELWGNQTGWWAIVVLDNKNPPRNGIALWQGQEIRMVNV